MMREEEEEALVRQAKVTMVGWSSDDQYAVVACSDFAVRVWHTITGQLVYVLQVNITKLYDQFTVSIDSLYLICSKIYFLDVFKYNSLAYLVILVCYVLV